LLTVALDLGKNNEALLEDPLHIDQQERRVSGGVLSCGSVSFCFIGYLRGEEWREEAGHLGV